MDGIYKRPRERSGTNEFTESFYADGTTYYREGKITDESILPARVYILIIRAM